jgi:mono/diheme cytochrome c family protein
MFAPEYGGDNRKRAEPDSYNKPVVAFPAHWAPIQMALYAGTQFPEKYRGGMFVAFHGSWNRAPRSQAGYNVCFVPFDDKGLPKGTYERFADGFSGLDEFTRPGDARFRPAGVAVGPDGSLYIGETEKGRIWRVIYTGEPANSTQTRRAPIAAAQTAAPIGADTPGGKIYLQVCAACHMPNGSGVPGMQPALTKNPIVSGDTSRLIDVLLKGPATVLPADREKFSNVMPPFAVLNDADIAGVLTYLRKNFAPAASDVTAAQVAARRGP